MASSWPVSRRIVSGLFPLPEVAITRSPSGRIPTIQIARESSVSPRRTVLMSLVSPGGNRFDKRSPNDREAEKSRKPEI